MERTLHRQVAEWIITAGGAMFVIVLFVAAYWEADIRWLHFFQSLMYIAAVVLSWRGSRWGYFIGTSAAVFWNYINLFVTTFLKNGLEQVAVLVRSGHLPRPDQFISVPGWTGNLILIVGCLLAYYRCSGKRWSDALKLLASFVATLGFFAAAMALFQPRYLDLFPRLLHPHLRI